MEQRRDIENTKPACRLILASASPRRRELLERIGLKPEIHPSTLEENPLCTEPAQGCDGTGGTEGARCDGAGA